MCPSDVTSNQFHWCLDHYLPRTNVDELGCSDDYNNGTKDTITRDTPALTVYTWAVLTVLLISSCTLASLQTDWQACL